MAISVEDRSGVRMLELDCGSMNLLDADSISALAAELARAEASPEIEALVLLGREDAFCAGLDGRVLAKGGDFAARTLLSMGELLVDLYRSRLRLVCGCRGHAVAAGAMLLLVADERIGGDRDYKLGFSELSVGMPLPALPIELARERLDRRALHASTALGRLYGPDEGVSVGFLDRVVPDDSVEQVCGEAAARLAELPGQAYATTLATLRRATLARLESLLELERSRLS